MVNIYDQVTDIIGYVNAVIHSHTFNHIRIYNQTNCGCIRYKQQEQRYKFEVEKTGEYEYIRSYRRGDKLPNGKDVILIDIVS